MISLATTTEKERNDFFFAFSSFSRFLRRCCCCLSVFFRRCLFHILFTFCFLEGTESAGSVRVCVNRKKKAKKKIKNKLNIKITIEDFSMSQPVPSLRGLSGGASSSSAVSCSASSSSCSRASALRVEARRELSSRVPAPQCQGRSLSRLHSPTPLPPPPSTQHWTSSSSSTSLTVIAALPSKWPRRKRSPSPRRRRNSNNNDDDGNDDEIETVPPPPPRPPSLWRWRARARGHRHERQRLNLNLPAVDWSRQNLQILFVDSTGVTRSRFAALLTERVGDWCGLGRALAPSAAGLYSVDGGGGGEGGGEGAEEEEGQEEEERASSFDFSGSSSAAALMAQASRLSLRPKALAAPRAPAFELSDLDAFDLVVAVDAETKTKIFDLFLGGRDSPDALFYSPRIARLGDFAACRSPGKPLNRRGSDTLDEELAAMLSSSGFSGSLSALGNVVLPSISPPSAASENAETENGSGSDSGDVPRVPSLSGPSSGEDFDRMIRRTVRGVAGLVQYLADGLPLEGDGGER